MGLSFTSYVPLESGTILSMEIFTPFGKCFVEGEIKQMREIVAENSYFVGIKFSHFSAIKNMFVQCLSGRMIRRALKGG